MKRCLIIGIIIIIGIISFIICSTNVKSEEENECIEKMKNEVGLTGNNDIYEIQKDLYTNQEVINVKAAIKYKVAFAGFIKQDKPLLEEVDEIFYNNIPKYNGIWISENDRKKITETLNNSELFESKYSTNKEGYLCVLDEKNKNDNDIKLQNAMKSNKQNILCISSICYIVDEISGEILDYSFEKMDKYQIYEYFEDENKKIVFITENSNKQLKKEEIIKAILNILN